MIKSLAIVFLLLSASLTTWALPGPGWFPMNHPQNHQSSSIHYVKDANASPQISQLLPLASSLQAAITSFQSRPSSQNSANVNNNFLNTIFPNGLSPLQVLQLAQQVQNVQQAISAASSNSVSPSTSAINITSDLLNLVTLIRSPTTTNKTASVVFQNELNNLITQYVPDAQSQANLLKLVQQIKTNSFTVDSIKFDKAVPAQFYIALHQLITKYTTQ